MKPERKKKVRNDSDDAVAITVLYDPFAITKCFRVLALIKEATKGEVLCSLRVIGDKPPGREVLFPANHCQCFHKSMIVCSAII